MFVVISPAKTLDFESPARTTASSMPTFLKDSEQLIQQLRKFSPSEIAELMNLSDKLAVLNSTRYESWKLPFTAKMLNKPCSLFVDDVYLGLDADSFTKKMTSLRNCIYEFSQVFMAC